MPSEIDPLLPKGNSAPEISGYGFSLRGKDSSALDSQDERDTFARSTPKTLKSRLKEDLPRLRNILILFILVVGLAILITFSTPGVLDSATGRPHSNDSAPSINVRVDSILSDVPLIGCSISLKRRKM